ncbi:hypothetical protein BJF93_23525 [Xaviernesmea oryzae]|uniref:Glucose uptake protein n=1 Tax=Xaviernesmea oryzae TaxID=464029 RepID=A0A1Q9B2X0_9HYPH|nr:hypothetical protein [Xaviernesmea oryzae]OLP62333.1 hypothetical protein BJF93_23525 [Xaviernesmea oryzae]SEL97120.1 glucose uptake protein [Xaviernesmea oryzae]
MSGRFLLLLVVSIPIFLVAATVSRAYVSSERWPLLVLSLLLYCIGNLLMIRLMREGGLGLAISLSAIGQLVAINGIAFVVFGERLTVPQMAGVALGVVAMGLMLFPTGSKP